MALSLKPRHLSRYRDIAALLVKHGRAEGLRDPDEATTDDAEKLVTDLEAMGPTFIKLGQLLSTRADLLAPPYLDALARLQDDVEPFSFADVERIVTDELGVRISNGFRSFDHRPLASASLGQVHRAMLRDGREVVVKVQRPGASEQVAEDMDVIDELAEFVDEHTKTGRHFGFAGMVEEFRAAITAELDYRLEAEHLHTLHGLLQDFDRIVVPQPIDDYTTARVLTMEYVEGRNISAISPLARTDIDGAALADELFRAFLDQILVHGFVHADPHPGNVLLTSDGRLALIDLGMITRVDSAMQDKLLRLLVALSDGKGEETAEVLVSLVDTTDEYDRDAFVHAIVELVHRNQSMTVGRLQAGRVVGDLARISAENGLRPPSAMTMLAKALLNLDQVACSLAPDFDPNEAMREHLADVMRQKVLHAASPVNVASAVLDAKEFAERLPSRVNKVMDALAKGELTLNVKGIDEAELMRGIQKLANRVTSGLVVAALLLAGAMIGESLLATVMFVVAAVIGVWLVSSALLIDLPQHRRRRQG